MISMNIPIKDIYDITWDLVDRINKARTTKLSEDVTAAMLYAEIEVNKEVLRGIKNVVNEGKELPHDLVSMLSTDALEIALFQKDNAAVLRKYFSKCEIPNEEGGEVITGTSAAFFVYRKVAALKHMAAILHTVPGLKGKYRLGTRIRNLEKQMDALNRELLKTLNAYFRKKRKSTHPR